MMQAAGEDDALDELVMIGLPDPITPRRALEILAVALDTEGKDNDQQRQMRQLGGVDGLASVIRQEPELLWYNVQPHVQRAAEQAGVKLREVFYRGYPSDQSICPGVESPRVYVDSDNNWYMGSYDYQTWLKLAGEPRRFGV